MEKTPSGLISVHHVDVQPKHLLFMQKFFELNELEVKNFQVLSVLEKPRYISLEKETRIIEGLTILFSTDVILDVGEVKIPDFDCFTHYTGGTFEWSHIARDIRDPISGTQKFTYSLTASFTVAEFDTSSSSYDLRMRIETALRLAGTAIYGTNIVNGVENGFPKEIFCDEDSYFIALEIPTHVDVQSRQLNETKIKVDGLVTHWKLYQRDLKVVLATTVER